MKPLGLILALLWILFGITGVIWWMAGDGAFLAAEMLRFAPPEDTGLPAEEYPGMGDMIAGYLTGRAERFQYEITGSGEEPLRCFHDYEAAHMADCRGLIRLDGAVAAVSGALALALTGLAAVRFRRDRRLYRGLRTGLRMAAVVMGSLLAWALVDFDGLFITFHRVAFTNDGWLLNPRTDLLIRLMPEKFFVSLGIRGALRAMAVPLAIEVVARIAPGSVKE